jgi:hypothetical protein
MHLRGRIRARRDVSGDDTLLLGHEYAARIGVEIRMQRAPLAPGPVMAVDQPEPLFNATSRLTGIQEYGYPARMKATIEIPDELYRRVKAKSALEGLAVREVATTLFDTWVEDKPGRKITPATDRAVDRPTPAWFGAAHKYARRVSRHDMESIRRSIARGRAQEAQ